MVILAGWAAAAGSAAAEAEADGSADAESLGVPPTRPTCWAETRPAVWSCTGLLLMVTVIGLCVWLNRLTWIGALPLAG